ncbi:putative ribosome-binding factor A [Hibiscus syriacus]|uniref:Ribosome-binding factor A n=1 Tax=Hibiscus syriacus TaxID=106335 RepID=A0A6A3AYW3_HIBSY|nr:putative ribosome-binding factor A [Hibiscus syriacus]
MWCGREEGREGLLVLAGSSGKRRVYQEILAGGEPAVSRENLWRGKEIALSGLKSKAIYVRSELGKRMKLRLTPEIRFIENESLERGSRESVIAILDRTKDEKKTAADEFEEEIESSDQDDKDWDGEDPDEDIIYIK